VSLSLFCLCSVGGTPWGSCWAGAGFCPSRPKRESPPGTRGRLVDMAWFLISQAPVTVFSPRLAGDSTGASEIDIVGQRHILCVDTKHFIKTGRVGNANIKLTVEATKLSKGRINRVWPVSRSLFCLCSAGGTPGAGFCPSRPQRESPPDAHRLLVGMGWFLLSLAQVTVFSPRLAGDSPGASEIDIVGQLHILCLDTKNFITTGRVGNADINLTVEATKLSMGRINRVWPVSHSLCCLCSAGGTPWGSWWTLAGVCPSWPQKESPPGARGRLVGQGFYHPWSR
jgi:hypothetical protein